MSTQYIEAIAVDKDYDFTVAAKQIFGDKVVKRAAFASDCINFISARKAVDTFRESGGYEASATENRLNIPTAGAVVIEFFNGRKVIFSTSEWAHIQLIEDQIVEV